MSNNNRITMISAPNSCPKCHGTGNVGYRRANGVCFRCNGFGFISKTSTEGDSIIAAIKARPASSYATPAPAAPDAPDNWMELLYSQS
jgi:DnaJ-class molecular chaperone